MTDWNGDRLTLQHHEASKGRVVAAANKGLHTEALAILSSQETPSTGKARESMVSSGCAASYAAAAVGAFIAGVAVGWLLVRRR